MKYLFLDIEWNQINNTFNISEAEILEIAGICYDCNFQNEKSFFKIVKPLHLKRVQKRTLEFLKLSRTIIEVAKPMDEVLNKFYRAFPKFEVIIIWNQVAYDLFLSTIKQYKITLPNHRVVVLQEVLSDVNQLKSGDVISFEKAMKQYNIKYAKNLLHCSKHDVVYLKHLYCCAKLRYIKQYKNSKRKERSLSVSAITIFEGYRTNRKNFRSSKLKNSQMNLSFKKRNNPDELIGINVQITDEFIEETIQKICDQFKMDCKISDRVIFIRTVVASWRIYHDYEEIISIYHENYRKNRSETGKKKRKSNEGYHKQDIKVDSLYEALLYIHNHDKYYLNINKKKKNRIDMLFARIEKERMEKEA